MPYRIILIREYTTYLLIMKTRIPLVLASLFLFSFLIAHAETSVPEKDDAPQTLSDLVKDHKKYPGFFDIYVSEKDGSGYLVVEQKHLDKPILYFPTIANGGLGFAHNTGYFRREKIVHFRRYFDHIHIVAKTPRFYFDPGSALSRAADRNISEAVLVSAKIQLEETGKYAVKLKDIFLNEQLEKISPYPDKDAEREKKRFQFGKLTPEKSRFTEIQNFPKNTLVVVDYVFSNEAPKVFADKSVSDSRFVSVALQHTLIALPENDYVPRRDDARIGYFTNKFDDQTSEKGLNYRDVINRWHLQKKEPNAAISEPVKPITWWIENTTPMELRDDIRDAALSWNSAFEKIGFRNAVQVKIQPDDADWGAGDIRYNVLRWTSSPVPVFSGYGPRIANPLTGEIIAADIMLEKRFLDRYARLGAVYPDDGVLQSLTPWQREHSHCHLADAVQLGLSTGHAVLTAKDSSENSAYENKKMFRQALYMLILHEVGHTLGLNHNMMASQLHNATDVHNEKITNGIVTASVMDYSSVNLAPPGVNQGDYYQHKPGPYDDWAIEYGYSVAHSDPKQEEQRLEKILARSTEPQLAFGNDADDMRSPGYHIDPRINVRDMSSETIDYAIGRFQLLNETYPVLREKLLKPGDTYQELLTATEYLFYEFTLQAHAVSRYVGGVYLNRAVVGQNSATLPYTPTPEKLQRKAMQTLADHVFAPTAMQNLESLLPYLQKQRRSFSSYRKNEDPKPHKMLLSTQKEILDHLLHPAVLRRISDSGRYGNTYTLETMMQELNNAIFKADLKQSVNSYRRNLQVEYVNRLIKIAGLEKNSDYDNLSQANAVYQLKQIQSMLKPKHKDPATRIHRIFIRDKINRAFE